MSTVIAQNSPAVGAKENMDPRASPTPVSKAARIEALRVKKLSDKAQLPKRGSDKAAGYDMYSAVDEVVRVAPRSGLAWKNSIDTGAGVVDEDYRGPVNVILFNHSDVDFQVKIGDRVAQLILERICTPEVEEVTDLDSTVRGTGGFGSTGVSNTL
eukprot:CAMPEP_0177796224 /NCGR_PEP_ID=MMETSP0491_2-20121128/26668_1 /TAXON_ID=63592 /ORGANISM="Tetraselmis chuii, Strain PLY429" /LENGTH=155 /DNA_ID=CAMNT_0019319139 /DNA_START=143 /DNA_END=610 /DNA_ORIENTATION=-